MRLFDQRHHILQDNTVINTRLERHVHRSGNRIGRHGRYNAEVRNQVTYPLQGVYLEEFPQQLCRHIGDRCHLLKIHGYVLSTRLLYGFCHHAALAETARTDDHKMICAVHKLLDIGDLFHPVREIFFLDDRAELERVLHITHFFVTTFFVMQI